MKYLILFILVSNCSLIENFDPTITIGKTIIKAIDKSNNKSKTNKTTNKGNK